jgi:hypothetical protein
VKGKKYLVIALPGNSINILMLVSLQQQQQQLKNLSQRVALETALN